MTQTTSSVFSDNRNNPFVRDAGPKLVMPKSGKTENLKPSSGTARPAG